MYGWQKIEKGVGKERGLKSLKEAEARAEGGEFLGGHGKGRGHKQPVDGQTEASTACSLALCL